MLIWLAEWLQQFDAGFNVFSYLTMRAILSTLTALLIAPAAMPLLPTAPVRAQTTTEADAAE